jgi:hypothetical protein
VARDLSVVLSRDGQKLRLSVEKQAC